MALALGWTRFAGAQESGGVAVAAPAPSQQAAPAQGSLGAMPGIAPISSQALTPLSGISPAQGQTPAPGQRGATLTPQEQTAPKTGAPEAHTPQFVETNERNEFQEFVAQSVGHTLPIFGHNLFVGAPSTFAPVDRVPVTPDYVVGPGDELIISAWGQLDAEFRVMVDRNGQINLPKVGIVNVSGIRFEELRGFLKTAIGRTFRNFEVNVTLGQLRSIQVFVVGYAKRPGNYTVSSLSTLVNTLFASGGPSAKGSMRRIQLKRGNQLITEFDVYDLLLKGDKSKDVKLLPGDVIYIPPIGQLVAISGSVNVSAVYELKDQATLEDLVGYAGGMTTTAAGQKVTVERIIDRKVRKVDEFSLDKTGLMRNLQDGDLIRVLPLLPKFDNAITLRGNVAAQARYPWREGIRVRDIIPDKDALIVPDYWIKQNLATQTDISSTQRLLTGVKRILPEVNWDYAVIERLKIEDLTTSLIPFNLGKAVLEIDPANNLLLQPGDIITIFSKDDIQVPVEKQTKFVLLEGEVRTPGLYQTRPGETLRQLVARVGGLTPNAYLFGAEFARESTRQFQQKRLDEALDRLEADIQRNFSHSAQAALTEQEATTLKAQLGGQLGLVAKLRQIKASGRIVLEIAPEKQQLRDLPDLVLDDGDRLMVPPRPSTVSVIGAVYNGNAFIYQPDKRISDYLAQAGGVTQDGDDANLYVIRSDGSVISKRQGSLFAGFSGERLMPGDAIVVPERLEKFFFTKELRDWSQIFYQFALGVAGLKVLRDL